jgi:hypothetical protein
MKKFAATLGLATAIAFPVLAEELCGILGDEAIRRRWLPAL